MCIYVRLFIEKKKAAFRENIQQEGKRKIQKEDWNIWGYILRINKVSATEETTKQILW